VLRLFRKKTVCFKFLSFEILAFILLPLLAVAAYAQPVDPGIRGGPPGAGQPFTTGLSAGEQAFFNNIAIPTSPRWKVWQMAWGRDSISIPARGAMRFRRWADPARPQAIRKLSRRPRWRRVAPCRRF